MLVEVQNWAALEGPQSLYATMLGSRRASNPNSSPKEPVQTQNGGRMYTLSVVNGERTVMDPRWSLANQRQLISYWKGANTPRHQTVNDKMFGVAMVRLACRNTNNIHKSIERSDKVKRLIDILTRSWRVQGLLIRAFQRPKRIFTAGPRCKSRWLAMLWHQHSSTCFFQLCSLCFARETLDLHLVHSVLVSCSFHVPPVGSTGCGHIAIYG